MHARLPRRLTGFVRFVAALFCALAVSLTCGVVDAAARGSRGWVAVAGEEAILTEMQAGEL